MKQLNGNVFGRLTVIGNRTERIGKSYFWLCQCSCGKIKFVAQAALRSTPGTRSCGCLRDETWADKGKELTSPRKVKRKEHMSWRSMITRCEDEKHESYPRYGGRGIKVCERWRWSFQNFFDDIGPAPSPKHTIDRINLDGDYEPGNCRWASVFEQQTNKKTTLMVNYKGEHIALANLCRRENAPYNRVWRRYHEGMPLEDAIKLPSMKPWITNKFRTSPDPTVSEINILFQ